MGWYDARDTQSVVTIIFVRCGEEATRDSVLRLHCDISTIAGERVRHTSDSFVTACVVVNHPISPDDFACDYSAARATTGAGESAVRSPLPLRNRCNHSQCSYEKRHSRRALADGMWSRSLERTVVIVR